MRVVPNLYPALERQEVVISTPRHVRSLAELDDREVAQIALAWRARVAAEPGYVHALLNEGREAGASLPHSHTQLAWTGEIPPAVATEHTDATNCALCDLVTNSREVISERDGIVVIANPFGRLPYELLIAPREHDRDGFGERLEVALGLLADSIRRLHAVAGGAVPLNAWLHNNGHWHFEVLPRLTVMAGLELGAGIYVNTVDPAVAAVELRAAL